MRKIQFKQHILPHVIAVVVFLFITVLFFNPVFFSNRSLDQYDINQWKGGARQSIEYRLETGEEALWTNSMFSGMPTYLIDIDWSDGILTNLKIVASLGLPHPVRNIFLAFACFYIMLLAFGVRPYLAIAGALAFGLSSYMIIGVAAGHNARIGAIAFMPLVMAGIHLGLTGNRWLGGGLTALGLALQLRDNHLQITYYLILIVAIYGIIQLISAVQAGTIKDFLMRSTVLLAAAILAFGTFYGKFAAITEYSKYSMRGISELKSDIEAGENPDGLKKDYAFQYSNGILEPITLFIPEYFGGSSSHSFVEDEESETLRALQTAGNNQVAQQLARYATAYWGGQPYAAPYYIGAVMILFFAIGIAFAERKYVIWLVSVSVLGIMLSYGYNLEWFNYFMFDYFPGYNKFRSVTFAILLPVFAVPLLGMIGAESVLRTPFSKQAQKKFLIAAGTVAGIALLAVITSGLNDFMRPGEEQLPPWFLNALTDDRAALLRADAFRSLIFVLLAAGAVFYVWKENRLINFLYLGITFLVLVDSWSVDVRYFGEDQYRRNSDNTFFAINNADKEILRDTDPGYRVYNLQGTLSEARTSYYHNSLGGYHGAKIRRYQDLWDHCINAQTQSLIQGFQEGNGGSAEYGAINMLNSRYIVYGPDASNIIRNPNAFGNAWFVNNIIKASSPDEELAETCNISSRETAVIDASKFQVSGSLSDAGSIEVKTYTPNRIVYESSNTNAGFAVFSEIYYPEGWSATIDGNEADILRANYVLRALEVPAGEHEIVFEFAPRAYYTGDKIIMGSSIVLLLCFLGSLFVSFRKWQHDE